MAEIEYVAAWEQSSDRVRADALELWGRLKVLPASVEPEARAEELIYGAYIDGKLASVATAEVLTHHGLGNRNFALTRYLTAPEFRENNLLNTGAMYGHLLLQDWSKAHPEASLCGTMWTWTSKDEIYARKAPPYFPRSKEERDLYPRCILIGWLPDNIGVWVWWFDHIRV